jgi:uncharacterized protein (TIGR03118 family)
MHITRRTRWTGIFVAAGALGLTLVLPGGPAGAAAQDTYQVRNLVSDVPGLAQVTDPNLVNAWGVAFLGTSPLWVSDNEKDVATLYTGGVHGGAQTINPLVVNIPGGAPTGLVSNPTTSFVVHAADGSSAPARFLFVGESGHLSGWAPTVPPPAPSTQAQDAVTSPGAVYKGLAMGQTEDGPLLYAADFSAGTVDVYNGLFQRVVTAGNFQDRQLPDGFAPFNVAVLGGKVYVAYARLDADREDEVAGAGLGRLDVFSLDGRLLDRAAAHGILNAPWGLAIAPAGFGALSGDLLVGNFGDGRIHAFDPGTLEPTGVVRGTDGRPVSIDGLWALQPGNGTEGGTDEVLFTAGPQDETHGLLGSLSVTG